MLKNNIINILIHSQGKMSIPQIKSELELRNISEYRQGHLAGALRQILDIPGFQSPERGFYQYMEPSEAEPEADSSTLSYQMKLLYNNTINTASDLLNQKDIVNSSESEMQEILTLRMVIVKTKELLETIEQCNI